MEPPYDIYSMDGLILLIVFAAVTYAGHLLGGKISDRKGFFKAGGSLPWWAVSASITATAISSVTFITIPAFVFKSGGDMAYIQVLFGLMLGKVLTAVLFAKPYYENRNIHTTYDYISSQMDSQVGYFSLITGLVLTAINAAIRILTTALVLSVITGWSLSFCAAGVVGFAILWSLMGGLKMVIWTDFLLFGIFTFGAVFAILYISGQLQMSVSDAFIWLDDQAKLSLFNFSSDPEIKYTIWAGLFGASLGNLALASSQGTMQRVRACRSAGDAYKAYIVAAFLYITPICMVLVGLCLSVFYHENPLPPEIISELVSEPDRIFPYFISTEIPHGISAIFIIAIFAAGISTIDTYLTEVSDISISNIYERFIKPGATEKHYLFASRCAMLFWGLFYFALTMFFSRYTADGLLDMTFKFPNYVIGLILGTIILARFGIGSWKSYIFGFIAGLSTILQLRELNIGFFWWSPMAAAAMIITVWSIEYFFKIRHTVTRRV